MSQTVSIGRIVHFQIKKGQYRPAIVVAVHNKSSGLVNLQVFLDGLNDIRDFFPIEPATFTKWYTSVSPGSDVGQWRWPERT